MKILLDVHNNSLTKLNTTQYVKVKVTVKYFGKRILFISLLNIVLQIHSQKKNPQKMLFYIGCPEKSPPEKSPRKIPPRKSPPLGVRLGLELGVRVRNPSNPPSNLNTSNLNPSNPNPRGDLS